jgi:acetyl-CoA synthase
MGAIFMGFPVLTDQLLGDDLQIPDWYISEPDYDKIIFLALEVRGIKLAPSDIPIPINYGPAIVGETISEADTYVELGGGGTAAFELVQMVSSDEIVDGQVTVIGPEIDSVPEGDKLPLGIKISIFGRKMQADFESVIERRIHSFANLGEGIWHIGQRDMCRIRISKTARAKGLLIKHLGYLLLAKLKQEFPTIVDRVQITLVTDQTAVEKALVKARERYRVRDNRTRNLTDESVKDFYSCLICQSFAPNHVCIVTPERIGLCGAVSWLDAKASYEITQYGPNQPIPKGPALDAFKGMWQSINNYIYKASNNTIGEVNLYSLMDKPLTSSSCFEVILAIVPEANGFMLTTREYTGMTPCGMTFSTLAEICGSGTQAPGFVGIAKEYLFSKKFAPAEGGIVRIVWMPKALKESLREDFIQRSIEEGLGSGFIDKIADESIGTMVEEIIPFLKKNEHPCFSLESLI